MDIAELEELYAPTTPHQLIFTYCECYAQVERSMRIHRFGRLDSPGSQLVMFFCQLPTEDAEPQWTIVEVDPKAEELILAALQEIRVPVVLERRGWASMHYNRSLRFSTRGASVELWWDGMDNTLGDAIRPLIDAIRQVVKDTFDWIKKTEVGADDEF